MPMITRDKQGKRVRELSEEVEDPDTQLGKEAGSTDLVGSWLKTLLPRINRSAVILIYYANIDKTDIELYSFKRALTSKPFLIL
jgi:hypothetical protein